MPSQKKFAGNEYPGFCMDKYSICMHVAMYACTYVRMYVHMYVAIYLGIFNYMDESECYDAIPTEGSSFIHLF